jgi:hypothetical protein
MNINIEKRGYEIAHWANFRSLDYPTKVLFFKENL